MGSVAVVMCFSGNRALARAATSTPGSSANGKRRGVLLCGLDLAVSAPERAISRVAGRSAWGRRQQLDVVPSYVADAVHGRATDRGVVSVMVVDVQPAHKGTDSSAL